MTYYGVDWLAEILVCSGLFMVSRHIRKGWLVAASGSVTYCCFGYMAGSTAMMVSSMIYFCVNLYGWFNNKPS